MEKMKELEVMGKEEEEEVFSMEEIVVQLQCVTIMINELMGKMMELHTGLCETCKEKSEEDNGMVSITLLLLLILLLILWFLLMLSPIRLLWLLVSSNCIFC